MKINSLFVTLCAFFALFALVSASSSYTTLSLDSFVDGSVTSSKPANYIFTSTQQVNITVYPCSGYGMSVTVGTNKGGNKTYSVINPYGPVVYNKGPSSGSSVTYTVSVSSTDDASFQIYANSEPLMFPSVAGLVTFGLPGADCTVNLSIPEGVSPAGKSLSYQLYYYEPSSVTASYKVPFSTYCAIKQQGGTALGKSFSYQSKVLIKNFKDQQPYVVSVVVSDSNGQTASISNLNTFSVVGCNSTSGTLSVVGQGSKAGLIVGVIFGVIIVLAVGGALGWYFLVYRKRQQYTSV